MFYRYEICNIGGLLLLLLCLICMEIYNFMICLMNGKSTNETRSFVRFLVRTLVFPVVRFRVNDMFDQIKNLINVTSLVTHR